MTGYFTNHLRGFVMGFALFSAIRDFKADSNLIASLSVILLCVLIVQMFALKMYRKENK